MKTIEEYTVEAWKVAHPIDRFSMAHLLSLVQYNAAYHFNEWKRTRDRYYLGQFKAYARVAKRLSRLE